MVTYRYQELTDQGVPRFPRYVGVRIDGTWDGPQVPSVKAKPKTTKARPKAPKAKAKPNDVIATGVAQRFEHGGTKFWEIVVVGNSHTVRYGKLGAAGASKTKTFDDAPAAQSDADRLIRQKTGKGYGCRSSETTAKCRDLGRFVSTDLFRNCLMG